MDLLRRRRRAGRRHHRARHRPDAAEFGTPICSSRSAITPARLVCWPDGVYSAAAGLRLTTPDRLRIGAHAASRGGMWNGRRSDVPEAWIARSLAVRSPIRPWGERYGYLWYSGANARRSVATSRLSPATVTAASAWYSCPSRPHRLRGVLRRLRQPGPDGDPHSGMARDRLSKPLGKEKPAHRAGSDRPAMGLRRCVERLGLDHRPQHQPLVAGVDHHVHAVHHACRRGSPRPARPAPRAGSPA